MSAGYISALPMFLWRMRTTSLYPIVPILTQTLLIVNTDFSNLMSTPKPLSMPMLILHMHTCSMYVCLRMFGNMVCSHNGGKNLTVYRIIPGKDAAGASGLCKKLSRWLTSIPFHVPTRARVTMARRVSAVAGLCQKHSLHCFMASLMACNFITNGVCRK